MINKKKILQKLHKYKKYIDHNIKYNHKGPLTIQNFNKLQERYSINNFFSYRYVDENGIWVADNPEGMDSYLIGFELIPLIVAGNKATGHIESLLNRLPTGTIIYSIVHASPDIKNYLEHWAMARRTSPNPIYDAITKRRAEYLISWSLGNIHPIQGENFRPRTLRYYWFVKIPSHYTHDHESTRLFKNEIDHIINKVNASLKSAGVGVKLLSGVDIAVAIRLLANLNRDPIDIQEQPIALEIPLSQQVIDRNTSILVENNGDIVFQANKNNQSHYQRVLTVTEFPDTPFYLFNMASCLGSPNRIMSYIPGQFYAFSIIEILDTDIVRKKILAKMAVLQHQTAASNKWYQTVMRHLYLRESNVQLLYDAINKQGERAVKTIVGISICSQTKADLDETTNIVKSEWEYGRLRLSQEGAIALPMWLSSLPGQYTSDRDGDVFGLQRGVTMTALNAASLVHIQGDWQGSRPDQGGLLLMSRRGVLTCMNVFESLTNYNGVMAASSGSGKSFTTNEIATDFLSRGGMVRIIDAGRSYFNTAELTSGQNLVFNRKTGICINPFSAIHSISDLNEDLETLVTLVAQMAFPFGFGQQDMKDIAKSYEYRVIEEAISDVWKRLGAAMSIRDLYEWFAAQPEQRLHDVARQLRPWAYGRYAEWLVGKTNLEFSNPFLVLELDDLSQEPELQAVVLNLILAKIQREMYLSSSEELRRYGCKRPKLLIIDEAWNLLARPNTGIFIEAAYRRARKYLASIWIITQSFWDCDRTTAARVALDNSNWIIGLMQDIGSLKQAIDKGLLNFSEYALQQIKTLHKTDDYSEMYLVNKSNKGEGLYRLIVDPATYWTYTTHGSERAKLDALLTSGISIDDAITKLIEEKNNAK